MPDDPQPGTQAGAEAADEGQSVLAQISTQMVRAMKHYYGKGPTQAKSYLFDDLLFVVMRGGMTRAERTMLEAGQQDAVRDFRQTWENEMGDRLTTIVEQTTGRRVITYQSQVLFDPDMSVEIFVFDDQAGPGELEATAEAVRRGGDASAAMADDEEIGSGDEEIGAGDEEER